MATSKPSGLTAREILDKTTARVQSAARYAVIEAAEPRLLRGGFAALKTVTYSTADADGVPKTAPGKRYKTTVYATESGVRLHRARLKVACSCDAHVYWGGEYALWRKGAADLHYGNGEPPRVRNPKLIPWACKHIARVLRQILNKRV